jgi:hypothetical protein
MDIAARDQYEAGAKDLATYLATSRDALKQAGFEHDDIIQILCAGILRDAGLVQARAFTQFIDVISKQAEIEGDE